MIVFIKEIKLSKNFKKILSNFLFVKILLIQKSIFHAIKKLVMFLGLLSLSQFYVYCIGNISNNDLFENKRILIIGGTGFLGRSLTKELLKYNPKYIIIFSRDEVKHFNFSKIFADDKKIFNMIGDIRDYNLLQKITKNVDIVFHVAALKRIDTLEVNVEESIKTNVIGSLNVFNACKNNNVDKVVFISTDKACLPVNTYGGCKFISEKIFTNYDYTNTKTVFVATRFGNILNSTGSIIPIFIDKIKNGENIPLTDGRMTRFVIGKDEAIELIFDALRYGVGGEVFIKKDLPSLKVTDLIDVLKNYFNKNNKINIVGIRPGEKIHEILLNRTELPKAFEFKNYFVLMPSLPQFIEKNEKNLPEYIKKGKKLGVKEIKEYSSKNYLISNEKIEEILKKNNLL